VLLTVRAPFPATNFCDNRGPKGDRIEKPRGIEEGSRPSGRLAGETARPTASIRFFMKFRGRNAHPNRVEKPPACRPVGKLKHTLPRASAFSWDFPGRMPIQTVQEAYRTGLIQNSSANGSWDLVEQALGFHSCRPVFRFHINYDVADAGVRLQVFACDIDSTFREDCIDLR
jgi:hypothetical protein